MEHRHAAVVALFPAAPLQSLVLVDCVQHLLESGTEDAVSDQFRVIGFSPGRLCLRDLKALR